MSDFGTTTLDLEEKSDFRPISPRAGPKLTGFWNFKSKNMMKK
jgi:GDP-D-mannose dehydratase